MLVPIRGAQIWRPEINNNSILLFKRLVFSRELLYNHITFPPNALSSKPLKSQAESLLAWEKALSRALCWCQVGLKDRNSIFCIFKTKDANGLETCEKIYF